MALPQNAWALPTAATTSPDRSDRQLAQRTASPITIGVVQSADNADHWQMILQRFEQSNIPYQVIEQTAIAHMSDIDGIDVLLLPNIEVITSEQVIAIGSWLNGGGRLIASGPIGYQSTPSVQQALRSMLGAYWSEPLIEPTPLSQQANSREAWVRTTPASDAIFGGVVQPTGVTSTVSMTWQDSESEHPAVVTTSRTTFLGWYWGTGLNDAEFDQAWLQTAIARYGEVPADSANQLSQPFIESVNTPTEVTAFPQTIDSSSPTALTALPLETVEAGITNHSTDLARAPVIESADSTENTPQPSVISSSLSALVSVSRLDATPRPAPVPTSDPAGQVAPPGLEIDVNDLPIMPLQAMAMRRDVEELIGRFESALLLAAAARSVDFWDVSVPESLLLVASGRSLPVVAESVNRPTAITHAAIDQAHAMLDEFDRLVAAEAFAAARQQWHATRQVLWEQFPSDRARAQTEVRAVWLDRGTIVQAGSREELSMIFDRLQDTGINTVFFETVNAGYTIYPSQVAPEQNPLTHHWDPLAAAVELAHDRNMELHAWIWTFAAGNQRHNALLNQPDSYLGPLLTAHPDWANYDQRGNPIPIGQQKPFLDPANSDVRRYLLSLIEEIVTTYDVDGVQLDYIRYPFQDPGAGRTYGYGVAARQQFQQLTGVDPTTISPSDRDLWQQWTDFRIEQINSFVAETSDLLHQRDPDLILSTAVFALSEHDRTHKIQQQWEVWAERGDVDMIVTMSYAADANRLQQLVEPWLTAEHLGATLVLPSIRLLDLSEFNALDQIQALRDLPSGGFALFAAENLTGTLQARLSDPTAAVTAIPYRDPFGAATDRYDALQREWSLLLEHEQLWTQEHHFETWRSHAEDLANILDALAAQPSLPRLRAAQRSLQTFQTDFQSWSSRQAIADPYRVETWQNRLAALDSLLNYGERLLMEQSIPTANPSTPPPIAQQ
jgi:uncharacterized lipoprotein YddW (UPF0748 family)